MSDVWKPVTGFAGEPVLSFQVDNPTLEEQILYPQIPVAMRFPCPFVSGVGSVLDTTRCTATYESLVLSATASGITEPPLTFYSDASVKMLAGKAGQTITMTLSGSGQKWFVPRARVWAQVEGRTAWDYDLWAYDWDNTSDGEVLTRTVLVPYFRYKLHLFTYGAHANDGDTSTLTLMLS